MPPALAPPRELADAVSSLDTFGRGLAARRQEPPVAPQRTRLRRRKLTQSDYQALGAFRSALRRFLAFSEAEAKAHGLTPQQHQALLAIRAHAGDEAISIGELAESLLIKHHSAVGLSDRLAARALIARAVSPRDRRRVALRLTPEGMRVLETISRNNLGKLKASLPIFTDLLHALGQLELPEPAAEPLRRDEDIDG